MPRVWHFASLITLFYCLRRQYAVPTEDTVFVREKTSGPHLPSEPPRGPQTARRRQPRQGREPARLRRPPHPLRLPLLGEGRRVAEAAAARGRPGPRVGASAPAWCLTGSGGPPDATRCCAPRSAGAGSASTSSARSSSRFSTASSTPNPARTGTPGAGNGTTGSRASARAPPPLSGDGVAGGGAALSAGGRGEPV